MAGQPGNFELLQKDWVPSWFRTESTLNMEPSQLREACLQIIVSNQLEEGRMPSETILGAMKRNNQKNQTFHKQQVPWSHPNGADVGGGAQHPIEAPDVSRTPQQSAENGVWRHDKQEKKGTPGGAQKPRKPTSGAADWMVPSAKSKRVYPDECNGPFVKLPAPKSKKSPEEAGHDSRTAIFEQAAERRQKDMQTIAEQIKIIEQKGSNSSLGNTGISAKDSDLLRALKIEYKKLNLLVMQRRVKAQVLENACPPAARSSSLEVKLNALRPDMPPVVLFAAHPLDYETPHCDLSTIAETQLSRDSRLSFKSHAPVNLRYYDLKRHCFFEELFKHQQRFFQYHAKRREREKELARSCRRKLDEIEERERRKREKAEKDRLRALKDNDVESYYKLLKEHKNEKILSVLTQTDKYLRALGLAVKQQQKNTSKKLKEKGNVDEDEMEGDEDRDKDDFARIDIRNTDEVDVKALMQNKATYYQIAHKERESVFLQPDSLRGGTLRKYQLQGLQWLVSLYNNKLSGVLADEMGLGKTIQIVALIAYLMEVKNVRGPFLIVAPLSVIDNWVREFESWTPHVSMIIYHGDKTIRKNLQADALKGQFNVMLTSYEMVMKDANFMSRLNWVYIIVDEGHRMKNSKSKLTTTLSMKFPSKFRILITGTPLQNNLNELWSLLNFLLPDIFRHDSNFEEWFNSSTILGATGDTSEMDEEEKLLVVDRLHQVLRPFLLRRLKSDVEAELKPKIEKVVKCNMSACQWRLYHDIRNRGQIELQPKSDAEPSGKKRTTTNIMMELRKACNHPYLFWFDTRPTSFGQEIIRSSGKFELLHRLLPKFKATGHRVLIFFQMTRVMDIFGEYLEWTGHRYLRLDGSTGSQRRAELIEIFNAPDNPFAIFILSTKAGGLGLNLPAADTVIIFDSDWNPQNDLQAQDRAHRIGQTREVRVLRLVCANTMEEDILERSTYKKELGGAAIDGGMFNEKSTVEDRHDFLRKIFSRKGGKEKADVLTDEQMNRVLARDDEEFNIFQDFDRKHREKLERIRKEPLMSDKEVPSWLKYEEEKKLSDGQRKNLLKMEKASRKSRKRKIATYKEEDISHSSDLDSTTDEDAEVPKSKGKPGRPGSKKRGDEEADSEDEAGEGDDKKEPQVAKERRGTTKKELIMLAPAEDHNDDFCAVCHDGGDLVCCDNCSCAYHEHCLRAKAEDLPDPWHCPKCTGDFQKLFLQYMSNPQTSIQSRDFCDLCALEAADKEKGGRGPLVGCRKCNRAFHTICAGETDDIFTDNAHWRWECPECTGTAETVFAWSRLIVPVEPEPEAEGIFIEHKRAAAEAHVFKVDTEGVMGSPGPQTPAGRGRGRGRPPKGGDKAPMPPSASKAASKSPGNANAESAGPMKRGRGRPRKHPLPEAPPAAELPCSSQQQVTDHRDGDGDGDEGIDADMEMRGNGSVRSPLKTQESPAKAGGMVDEELSQSGRKRRRLRTADEDD